jgi:hypothetical protein
MIITPTPNLSPKMGRENIAQFCVKGGVTTFHTELGILTPFLGKEVGGMGIMFIDIFVLMTQRDYYEVPGVGRNASNDDLNKTAFRQKARQLIRMCKQRCGCGKKNLKSLMKPMRCFRMPISGHAYDRFGHAGVRGAAGMPDFSVDFSDLSDIFDFFGFGSFGRRSRRSRNAPRRGAPIYNIAWILNIRRSSIWR